MDAISVVQKFITAILVTIAVALVVGQLLGQPFLLGYVATGSMDPTLAVGDGFIAMPPLLAGDISPGDVITYEAQSIDGGGPTTHRVVGENANGYITQGDANPFTDQDAGEPPVTDAQVHAVLLQLNGDVVVLPSLGLAATAIQRGISSGVALLGIGAGSQVGVATTGFGIVLITVTLIYGFLTSDTKRKTDRSTSRSGVVSGWLILGGLVLILFLPLVTSMAIPSGTTTTQMLSTESSVDTGGGRIQAGGTRDLVFSVDNNLYIPKVVLFEPASSGVEVVNSTIAVSHGEQKQVKLTLTAPEDTGTFARSRSEHHYLYVLPIPVIEQLHAIHPFVAMVTISLVLIAPVVAVYLAIFGVRPISLRATHR